MTKENHGCGFSKGMSEGEVPHTCNNVQKEASRIWPNSSVRG